MSDSAEMNAGTAGDGAGGAPEPGGNGRDENGWGGAGQGENRRGENGRGEPRVIVMVGSGGVGKTTSAAALAVGLAESGLRTVVMTIDPAKRLAQALGLADLGITPQPVAGQDGLHALMLDQDARFGALLAEAGAPELVDNRITATVARSFGGLHDYLAMDLLAKLHDSGEWDAIVVDTPPALSALDFLDSADRVRRLVLHPLMRLLTSSSALVGTGVMLLGQIVGSETLAQAAAFARGLRPVADSMLERSRSMRRRLDESGEFLVVTAPTAEALREARSFAESLGSQGLPVTGVVVNRTHQVPDALRDRDLDWDAVGGVALDRGDEDRMDLDPDAGDRGDEEGTGDAEGAVDAIAAMRLIHESRVALAGAEEKQIKRFVRRFPDVPLTHVPSTRGGVTSLADLRGLAERILPALD
ncbi:ArsA family ATPase [Corynebacterium hansenii]|uniref:ArsA family ATPase n=1 Tax=Corynebacterium hansenii TaxID=394964 RepID=A0ABV7ZPZ7_9CORY|nr:ArsA-related P-loop ATPase [Corynebacterium hansenii]WJY98847.1 Arsenical pump-driving ATPase [Corynebacterium hansenii]